MIVMKFGGSSMADAERQQIVAGLVAERAQHNRIAVVVSALAGVTNQLLHTLQLALRGEATRSLVCELSARHEQVIAAHQTRFNDYPAAQVRAQLAQRWQQLETDLLGINCLRECPPATQARILACGEQQSVQILAALLSVQPTLRAKDCLLLDASALLHTTSSLLEGVADFDKIEQSFAHLRDSAGDSAGDGAQAVLVLAGFIAGNEHGQLSLLGRNGSDLSGALVAMALHAQECEIWTDVDGVYSADPRLVAEASVIAEMSYEEAMELSYFGAKVLHPKTIAPIARYAIPTRIKNTFNPAAPGTLIHRRIEQHQPTLQQAVCGISCLDNIALINIAGPGMKGVAGMAARLFGALAKRQISIILITQSGSEYSISFCVQAADADNAVAALEQELELERRAGWLQAPELLRGHSIVSIVGDGMRLRKGVAACFFKALAQADINVVAIAQGSSERAISAVIEGRDSNRAFRASHQQFFSTLQTIALYVIGVGGVGRQLLQQIAQQQQALRAQGVAVEVHAIANSKAMLLQQSGIELQRWPEALATAENYDLDKLLAFIREQRAINPVVVDCTASEIVARRYLDIFAAGAHIVTPNKRANTLDEAYYQALRTQANRQQRRFLYETTVGAGLPVIDTLQNLIKSGDALEQFSGLLSGSMSYVFGLLDEGVAFSEAVKLARAKQYTEPDPRDDLSGLDVARKLLVLFREAGGRAELSDIAIRSPFPDDFDSSGAVEQFMARLPALDAYFSARMLALKAQQKTLRFAAEIRDGRCSVGVIEVDSQHPLYAIKGGENALAFHTRRYQPVPLVIRGYGAGVEVTAAGVFGDILRTVSFNPLRMNN